MGLAISKKGVGEYCFFCRCSQCMSVWLPSLRRLLGMARKQKPAYYAVARGRQIGIYKTWAECEAQVSRANGAVHKSFSGLDEAVQFMKSYHKDFTYSSIEQGAPESSRAGQNTKRGLAEEGGAAILQTVKKPKLSIVEKEVPNEKTEMVTSPKSTRLAQSMHSAGDKHERRRKIKEIDIRQSEGDTTTATRKSNEDKQIDIVELNSDEDPASRLPIKIDEDGVRTIECYTDGAASQNGKLGAQAGWGVYWPESEDPRSDLHKLNESRRLPGHLQTNNRAELMGIIRAIELCPDPKARLIIYTDSMYSIKAINEWQRNWRMNKWLTSKKEPVLNKDLIRLLERLLRGRILRPTLIYVKGHSSSKGNQEADRLAVAGAKMTAVAPHLWTDLEPSDSEEEDFEKNKATAMAMWQKAGFTAEQARRKVEP